MSQSKGSDSGAGPSYHRLSVALVESFRLTLDGENHTVPIAAGETLLQAALAADFSPLSDVRASASYRTTVAGNLLLRALHEFRAGAAGTSALTVTDYA